MPTPVSRTRSTASPLSANAVDTITWPPGPVKLDRVRQEIEHDLAQRALVGDDLGQSRRERSADDDPRAARLRLHDADALLRQLVEADIGEVEVELAGLDLGKIEQIVEQRDEVRAGDVDVLEIFA